MGWVMTAAVAASERRQADRCDIDLFVQEVLEDRTYLHPAINLSTDGIYVLAHDDRRAVDGDQVIALEFTLPTGQTITAHGRVTRVDDWRGQRGLGIEFVKLSDRERALIRGFAAGLDDGAHPTAAAAP